MSKLNKRKSKDVFSEGIIAGRTTTKAGKYTNEDLLRRVTMANLLWESTYYQTADAIQKQMDKLLKLVDPEYIADLAVEIRFEQKLRHTPIYLALALYRDHRATELCEQTLTKICTRPDMTIDTIAMAKVVLPNIKIKKGRIRNIPNCVKRGLAKAFNHYDYYQISKYKKTNLEISLVDVVNLCHPKPTQTNEQALHDLVRDQITPPETWEVGLSQGKDKRKTFIDLIDNKKLGALATLRNLRNMIQAEVPRGTIIKALTNVKSSMLTPLNFLAAARYAPEYSMHINMAMERSFARYKIPGTTIIALDVSGSMGALTSKLSDFSRLDLGFALMALACYIFEDPILVYTAGSDVRRKGKHMIAPTMSGLDMAKDWAKIRGQIGGGGIFNRQLSKWLIDEGHAKDADRLVVLSDSQDIDAMWNKTQVKADLTPYKTSYIIDISHHTHGIKTGNWTAEINGWSDKLFHYIYALERTKQ